MIIGWSKVLLLVESPFEGFSAIGDVTLVRLLRLSVELSSELDVIPEVGVEMSLVALAELSEVSLRSFLLMGDSPTTVGNVVVDWAEFGLPVVVP